jgi:hypothetical protein
MGKTKDVAALLHRAVFEIDRNVASTLRDSSGAEVTDARRDELLAAVKDGKHVELEMDIRPFQQTPGVRNRNSVRFRDGAMRHLGSSGKGMPFLRDHDQGSQLAIGGFITKSRMESVAVDGGGSQWVLHQTVKLTAPWAVEQALRGLIRFFSIGWSPGDILCLACGEDFRKCWHWPGERMEDGNVVEIEYQSADLVETSAVPVPAVLGTGVEAIRAAMAAARAGGLDAAAKGHQSGRTTMKRFAHLFTLLALSALPESADEDDAIDAIGDAVDGLNKKLKRVELDRDELKLRAETAEKDLATANETLGKREAKEKGSKLDQAIATAYAEKKLLRTSGGEDGERVDDPMEDLLRRVAEVDGVDAAVAKIGKLRVREIFAPQITAPKDPQPRHAFGAPGMSADQIAAHRRYAEQTGKNPDEYIAELIAEQGA